MEQNRREFLKGTAWMGLAATAAETFGPAKLGLKDAGEQQTV